MRVCTIKTTPQGSNTAMPRPTIIVAGKNQIQRTRAARMLSDGSISIETTGSAAHLMEMLLHGGLAIVVLIDGLEEGLSFAHLVPLLKSCSSRAIIILAADGVSHAEELCIRQQGVFYRTNQPACAEGWDELQLAVDCAWNSALSANRPFQRRAAGKDTITPYKGEKQ